MLDHLFSPKTLQLKKKQKPEKSDDEENSEERTDDDGYEFVEKVGVNTSLAALRTLAYHLQCCTACNAAPHAMPHRLQNSIWPPGGPQMAEYLGILSNFR